MTPGLTPMLPQCDTGVTTGSHRVYPMNQCDTGITLTLALTLVFYRGYPGVTAGTGTGYGKGTGTGKG